MEELELVSCEIIANVGSARSCYIEAIQRAKDNKFEEAEELLSEGDKTFLSGHNAHATLVQKEAGGNAVQVSLLLAHAEDQLMSAEGFKILAKEFIDLYKKISQE